MNFKKTALTTAVIFTGMFSGIESASAVPTTVTGGKVNFIGEVVDTACGVSPDSANLTVPMGQVPVSAILAEGGTGEAISGGNFNETNFQLELVDCSEAAKAGVTVKFTGEVDTSDATLYKVGNNVVGAAQGVGLTIKDSSGTAIEPGSATSVIPLSEGTNLLPFSAAYVGDGAATAAAGDASVTMDFELTYQ